MIEWLVSRKLFRNDNHAIWFLSSIGFLIVLLVSYFKPTKLIFLVVPVIVHVPPLVTATYKTAKNESSELYSKDCIWFNALMIFIYVSIFTMVG